jgi:hypothetical protein
LNVRAGPFFIAGSRDESLGHEFDKRLESLLHASLSLFYWQILQKTTVFKTPYKKIREARKLKPIHE